MENFTPVSAAIGGALIGLSAVLLMALNGGEVIFLNTVQYAYS